MDEAMIRRRIQEMLQTGALPCDDAAQVWGSTGDGVRCSACAEAIAPADVQFDVDLRSGLTIHLHRRCHQIWVEECEPLKQA
jgi:hypothetical protein